ncbi:hypothetical protein [Nocardiopsis sp. CC223A]|uniref:hypothetical protein n=1 Tax=Nocardiopsis sp. CC223A TaxID=3044051 RepID=UPI0035562075
MPAPTCWACSAAWSARTAGPWPEHVGHHAPYRMQHLLGRARMDETALTAFLRGYVTAHLGTDPETGEQSARTVLATIIGPGSKVLVEITIDPTTERDAPEGETVSAGVVEADTEDGYPGSGGGRGCGHRDR